MVYADFHGRLSAPYGRSASRHGRPTAAVWALAIRPMGADRPRHGRSVYAPWTLASRVMGGRRLCTGACRSARGCRLPFASALPTMGA